MKLWEGKKRRLGIRKPWLLVALGLLVATWLGWRTLGGGSARDEHWARIQRERVLRVGMDASFPPFESVDEAGHFAGLDVDLATELARRWGVRVAFVNVSFDGLYDALQADKFDLIISALPYDRTETRDLRYSPSYFNAGLVLLARRDEAALRSFGDLAGKRVAVELGSEAHQTARQLARDGNVKVEIVTVRDPLEVVQMVREGQAEALICDRVTAYGYLKGDGGLQIVGPPLTDEPYVIATPIGAPVLAGEIDAALSEWRENWDLEALLRHWLD